MQHRHYCVNTEIVAAKIYDDEAIVINTATGRYYDFEGSGPAVWRSLEAGASAVDIAASLHARFHVEQQTAVDDVLPLLARLADEGLIVEVPAPAAPVSAGDASLDGARERYVQPALTTFTDMQELLAADPPLPAAYTPTSPQPDRNDP